MDRRTALKTLLALPAVQTIAVDGLQPGDVIVVECDEIMSAESTARIKSQLATVWPDHKIVVFEKGFRMRVARQTVLA